MLSAAVAAASTLLQAAVATISALASASTETTGSNPKPSHSAQPLLPRLMSQWLVRTASHGRLASEGIPARPPSLPSTWLTIPAGRGHLGHVMSCKSCKSCTVSHVGNVSHVSKGWLTIPAARRDTRAGIAAAQA